MRTGTALTSLDSREPHGSLPRTASPLVRTALLAYTFLVVYASLYPFSGWHSFGLSPFAYLDEKLPKYWTWFDVSINVIGYIPFGMLLVLAGYPLLRRRWAFVAGLCFGALLSAGMEAIQTYLPTRVASLLDLYTNCLGLFIGLILGAALTHLLLEKDMLHRIRTDWFVARSSGGLIVMALWPLAQIYPQGYLFGHGQLVPRLSSWLTEYAGVQIDVGSWLRQGVELSTEQYWLSETLISACGLTGAALMVLCLLKQRAPKVWLLGFLMVATLSIKSLALALLFRPEHAFSWLSPGAQAGLLVGIMMLYGLAFVPQKIQRHLAIIMLSISLIILNIVPENPYFIDTLSTWVQGKFLNFNGAALFLSQLWPWLALWFLLHFEA